MCFTSSPLNQEYKLQAFIEQWKHVAERENVRSVPNTDMLPFPVAELRTPCYILDVDVAKANAERMLERAKVRNWVRVTAASPQPTSP